ncbi:MAG: hypothetical protein K6F86_03745 [Lachnospiraceae bacterium]|nr:hypothetical protein [Lachnospiraceae bacterium]
MADMEINVNRNPIQVNDTRIPVKPERPDTAPKTQETEGTAQSRPEITPELAPKERIEETLENVVSVSEDGDTVQVTEESSERLEEDAFGKMAVRSENNAVENRDDTERREETGNIQTVQNTADTKNDKNEKNTPSPTRERIEKAADPNKPDPAKERLKAQRESDERRKEIIKDMVKSDKNEKDADRINDKKEEQKVQQNITTYTGYTKEQLQKMVRDGQISQNDYNKEMDARKERTEEAVDRNNEFSRDMAADIAKEEQAERTAQEMRTVFSEDSNDVPDAETRAEVLNRLQDFNLNN